MHKCEIRLSILGLLPALIPVSAIAQTTPGEFPVNRANLCVTEGEIADGPNHRLAVDACAPMSTYRPRSPNKRGSPTSGPPPKNRRSALEKFRRQFGLKLRAKRLQSRLRDVAL
jgi:hypothetical protein